MQRFILALWLLVGLCAPAYAQGTPGSATVIATCGTPPTTYTPGQNKAVLQDTTGRGCVTSSGSISGTVTANQGAAGTASWPINVDQTTPGTTNGVVVNSSALPTGAATSSLQSQPMSNAGVGTSTALTVQGNSSGVAIPVSGTVTITPSGTQAANLTQVNTAAVNVGTGAAGTGTQRVTTSTDSTIGTVTAVTAITNALPAGTNVIGHVINDASSAVIGHVITDTTSTTAVTQATPGNLNAAVSGPTAIGSAASTPPIYVGGTIGGGATNNVIGLNLTSNGSVQVAQGTAGNLNATVVGTGTFATQDTTTPGQRTLVTLDVKTVTTGGTAVNAISAGHRTAGGFLQNPFGATAALCINEIGAASGTTSSGDTTCIQPGWSYRVTPAAGAVSVVTSDSTHPFSGYGVQ